MVFKCFHGLFGFAFFEVVHFELVIVQKFQVVVDLNIALFSWFDELTDSLALHIVSWTVGIVEGIWKSGDIIYIGSLDTSFKVVSHR